MLTGARKTLGRLLVEYTERLFRFPERDLAELDTIQSCPPRDNNTFGNIPRQVADLIGHSPFPVDLHGPRVDPVGLRITREFATPLQDQAAYPGTAEGDSTTQADRPGPDDQHLRLVTHVRDSPPRPRNTVWTLTRTLMLCSLVLTFRSTSPQQERTLPSLVHLL